MYSAHRLHLVELRFLVRKVTTLWIHDFTLPFLVRATKSYFHWIFVITVNCGLAKRYLTLQIPYCKNASLNSTQIHQNIGSTNIFEPVPWFFQSFRWRLGSVPCELIFWHPNLDIRQMWPRLYIEMCEVVRGTAWYWIGGHKNLLGKLSTKLIPLLISVCCYTETTPLNT